MRVPVLLIAVAVATLAACTRPTAGMPPSTPSLLPSPSPSRAPSPSPSPSPRASSMDCGREALGQPSGVPNAEARACIAAAAAAGTPARFVSVLTTIEGDPIPQTIEVQGRDRVTLTVDSTQDRFSGTLAVETHHCDNVQLVPSPDNPSRQSLHVQGCDGLTEPYVIH